MTYSSSFFKALGISIGAVGIPSLFTHRLLEKSYTLSTLKLNSQTITSESPTSLYEYPEEIGLTIEEIRIKREEKIKANEFCPKDTTDKRRNYRYCTDLKDIIDSLEEIKTGFSHRVYLKLPTKENVSIPIRKVLLDKDQNTLDTFNYYFKDNSLLENKKRKDFIYYLWRGLTPQNDGNGGTPEVHTQKLLTEIHKYFPNIRIGHYHKWRYVAIMRRLANNGDNVILKPIYFYRYYHFFKDPWVWGVMVDEAQYFYYSGGSKWAGGKDKRYILNFTDALNAYIPEKKLN